MSAAEEVEVEMLQEILIVATQIGERLALERQRLCSSN